MTARELAFFKNTLPYRTIEDVFTLHILDNYCLDCGFYFTNEQDLVDQIIGLEKCTVLNYAPIDKWEAFSKGIQKYKKSLEINHKVYMVICHI